MKNNRKGFQIGKKNKSVVSKLTLNPEATLREK
jgi:hypothetical protein